MNRKDLSKEQQKEYDRLQEINPEWTPDEIFAEIDTGYVFGEGFEESEQGQRDDFPDSIQELMASMIGAQTPKPDEEEEIEKILEDTPSDDPDETDEERLERQIDYFNSLRDHDYVSDDEDYLRTTTQEAFELGNPDPSGNNFEDERQNREMTKIVEALQRRAMEQGSPAQTAGIPLGMDGQSILPQNPMDQQLRDMSGVGRQAQQLQNTPQQADLMELQRQMEMKAMENIRMQTLQVGGGQGPGTSYNRDPVQRAQPVYNPWRGNPQSRFQ